MKLQKLIDVEHVYLGLEADDARSALEALASAIDPGVAPGRVVQSLLERERLGSTAVGDGFAIPHSKLPGLKSIYIALARLTRGVDFQAADGASVRFFFVVLSPPDQPAAHLQVLSQIARVLKRRELRSQLLDAEDAEQVVASIRRVAEAEGL